MADHSPKLCARYHHAVELLGRRWAGAILRILLDGPARYNALRSAIPEISDRMLAERLRELEDEGVLNRTVFPEVPVRVEYELTEKGRALEAAISAIGKWADRWVPVPEGTAASRRGPAPARRPAPAEVRGSRGSRGPKRSPASSRS